MGRVVVLAGTPLNIMGGFRYDRQLPLHKEVPLLQDEIQDSLLGFCRM